MTTAPTTYRLGPSSINLPSFRPSQPRRIDSNSSALTFSSPSSPPAAHSPSTPTTPEKSNVFQPSFVARHHPPAKPNTVRPILEVQVLIDLQVEQHSPSPTLNHVDEEAYEASHTANMRSGKDSKDNSKVTLKRKVVIMGATSVGKTSLTQQYIAPPAYNEQYFPTIEETSHEAVKFDGVEYDCEIVDSAGQDEYTLFPSKYAVGVHGYLLVYSINSRHSFDMIQTVHDKILEYAGLEKMPCVIVGQKTDLVGERRVPKQEGEALAKKLNAGFVESSAKNKDNVGKAFEVLLQEMQREYNPEPEKQRSSWWSWGR